MIERVSIHDILDGPLVQNFINKDEILSLIEKCGPTHFYRFYLDISESYFQRWNNVLFMEKSRRGEIALCVKNDAEHILLHTKTLYPEGTFRIPTGGIHDNETVIDALVRELYEETGFSPLSFQQLALLLYVFRHDSKVIPFLSYIFKVNVSNGEPALQDENEEISGFMWIKSTQLVDVIANLQNLPEGQWHEWGLMRAAPHEIIHLSHANPGK
jgi:8-oxo-dGTP pyrophosphatase MutT (NUDIX family)